MSELQSVRIDKFLWAVRIFKTRSLAAEECRKGRVIINNIQVKPSKNIVKGEIIEVRKPPVIYTFRVIDPVEKRIPAKMTENYIENLTTEEEMSKLALSKTGIISYREKGTGRPTKKERRNIDKLFNDYQNY
jgi:ribosome-associated heat shock protein Hsp15